MTLGLSGRKVEVGSLLAPEVEGSSPGLPSLSAQRLPTTGEKVES